jgi:hypothetical protein
MSLSFRGVRIMPRFDVTDRRLRPTWAGMHGAVARLADNPESTEADVIAELEAAPSRRDVTVSVTRTGDGIEVALADQARVGRSPAVENSHDLPARHAERTSEPLQPRIG